ncbi:hypothetical protein CKA32_005879 [Geitlerinema sp. FC II]|nr:hypothetical protein CKA32_005879 [Geitlerinema sp. FC II]
MYEKFWEPFILEGIEDDVGLWLIIGEVKELYPNKNDSEIRIKTLKSIQNMLEQGLIEVGTYEFSDDKTLEFKTWGLDINNIIQRIDREWNQLQREPNIGDICYVITSPKGKQEAEKILQEKG